MKTAEEILQNAYSAIKNKQSSKNCDVDPILIDAMKEYAEQFKPEWISIKDSLPCLGDYVLAANYMGMDIAEYKGDRFFIEIEATTMTSHWMPLPVLPKKSDKLL